MMQTVPPPGRGSRKIGLREEDGADLGRKEEGGEHRERRTRGGRMWSWWVKKKKWNKTDAKSPPECRRKVAAQGSGLEREHVCLRRRRGLTARITRNAMVRLSHARLKRGISSKGNPGTACTGGGRI